MASMTFLQGVNRLKSECGVTGDDLTAVTSQTGEYARLVNWYNSAWEDIQNMREDWEWMRTTATFPTVAGQPTYTTAQIGLTDFGNWANDTFRNYANPTVTITIASPGVITLAANNLAVNDTVTLYTDGALPTGLTAGTAVYVKTILTADTFTVSATAGGTVIATTGTQSGTHTMTSNNTTTFVGFASEIFMPYYKYDQWRDGYEYGALRQVQTRPTLMTVTPSKGIGLGPFPAAGYTVVGDYYKIATQLSLAADVPALPVQFQMAIVYRAMMSYGAYESASEVYQRGEVEFNKMIRRLISRELPGVSVGSALC